MMAAGDDLRRSISGISPPFDQFERYGTYLHLPGDGKDKRPSVSERGARYRRLARHEAKFREALGQDAQGNLEFEAGQSNPHTEVGPMTEGNMAHSACAGYIELGWLLKGGFISVGRGQPH